MSKPEWIIGINAVEQVLKRRPSDVACLQFIHRDGRLGELAALGATAGLPIELVERRALDRRFPGARHQGIAALVQPRTLLGIEDLAALVDKPDALVLVLDQVQDPRNFGACLRSAFAAGVDAVVFPRDRSAPLSPAARKAAAGAAEVVPLVQVTNLATALDRLKEAGVWLVGAVGGSASPPWDVDLSGRIAIVLGSEGEGLRRLTRERCDFLAGIPMHPDAESLNVSVATGIFLFEALRQRGS